MERRRFVGLIMATCLVGTVAFAASIADQIVRQLQEDGYTDIVIEKTWLGRVRITAMTADGSREIIINPSTGEILRDLWIASAGADNANPLIKNTAVKPAKTDDDDDQDDNDSDDDSKSGGDRDNDDDRDDDDDSDNDDDRDSDSGSSDNDSDDD